MDASEKCKGSLFRLIESRLLVVEMDNFWRGSIKYSWTKIGLSHSMINKVLLILDRVNQLSVEELSKHPGELRDQAFLMNQASLTRGSAPWNRRISEKPGEQIRLLVLLALIESFTTARISMIIQTPIIQRENRKCKLRPLTVRNRMVRD